MTFEVMDFQSAYQAILGRPSYARFMARPCYMYLKLKMSGPRGVITVTGNRQKAEDCFQKGSKIADAQMAAVELQEYQKNAYPSDLLRAKSLPRILHFSRLVKRSRFIFTRPIPMPHRLIYQRHSTTNRKKRSSSSSVRTGASMHGNF